MRIDRALRCAAITVIAAATVSGCAGRSTDETGRNASPTSTVSTPTRAASPTRTPTRSASPTVVAHTSIGPLLAPTQALVKQSPAVTFQLSDTGGGDPVLDAHGDLTLGQDLEALVYIEDVDGARSFVLVDGKAYRNDGEPGSDAWKTTNRKAAVIEVEELAVHRILPALAAGVTSLRSVGVVEEGGTSLAHYTYTANTKKTLDALDLVMEGRTPKTMTGALWVDSTSGVLTRVHMAIDDFRHELDLTYGTDPAIVAPPL